MPVNFQISKLGRFLILWNVALLTLTARPVEVAGNDFLGTRKIRQMVAFPHNFEEYDATSLNYWKSALSDEISNYYESRGFFDVQIKIVIISKTTGIELKSNSKLKLQTLGDWLVQISILEGQRYVYNEIDLISTDNSEPLLKKEELKSQPGDFFSYANTQTDKNRIHKIYGEAGFAKNKVELLYKLNDSLKHVDVRFEVDPSYLIIFDTLIIDNRRESKGTHVEGITSQSFVRRLLKFKKGDTLNLSETNKFKKKLKSTKVFNYVRIKDSLIAEHDFRSAILVKTEERVPGALGGNIFWETEDGFGIGSMWSHKNIGGRFYQGDFNLRLAERRQKLSLGLGNPLLLGSQIHNQNELNLIWRQEIEPDESPFDAQLSSALSWVLTRSISAISKLELVSTTDNIRQRVLDLNWINTLKMAWLDDPFNPRRGVQLKWIHGNGGPLLDVNQEFKLVDIRHNWFEANTSFYFPLLSNYIMAVRLDGGSFLGKGRTNSRRFFLGGNSSIRNREAGSICPEYNDENSEICREDLTPMYYLGSLELRMIPFYHVHFSDGSFWRHFQYFQIVPFSDYGKVRDKNGTQKEDGEGFDIGLGIRIPILLFNLRFDYAIGWKKGPDFSNNRIVIDLAQSF